VADTFVTIRHEATGETAQVAPSALPYWVDEGYVLDPQASDTGLLEVQKLIRDLKETLTGAISARDASARYLLSIASTFESFAKLSGALSGVYNGEALSRWFSIDPKLRTKKLLILGDSISDGGLAGSYDDTYPNVLQRDLRRLEGVEGGAGYIPATPSTNGAIVPAPPNTRNGDAIMWSHGLGGRAMYLNAADEHVTYTAEQCTQVRVYYGKTTVAGGGLKVQIDGVDQGVTLSSVGQPPAGGGAAVNSGGHVMAFGPLTPGPHTVKIVPSAPPFVGILEGVEFLNGDEEVGLRVYNGAHSGATVTEYLQTSMNLHWEAVKAIAPDAVVIFLGTNDIALRTVAEFTAGIDQIIAKFDSHVSITLVGGYLRGDYNTETGRTKWAQMQKALRARAQGRVSYIDIAPHFPELVANGSTSAGLMFDTPPIHPNSAGMKKIAEVLAGVFSKAALRPFVGPPGKQGLPGVNAVPAKSAVDTYVTELLGESSTTRTLLASQIGQPTTAVGGAVKGVIDNLVNGVASLDATPINTALKKSFVAHENVLKYGAVADGVTNARAAIQAAVNALPLNPEGEGIHTPKGFANGGTVFLPRGRYVVDGPINLRRGIRIVGEGRESTQIISKSTGSVFQYLDDGRYIQDEIVIEDLSIWQDASVTPTDGAGVYVGFGPTSVQSTKLIMKNVYIEGTFDGVRLEAAVGSSFLNVDASKCVRTGFNILASRPSDNTYTSSTSVAFVACYASINRVMGFRIQGGAYCALVGCASDSNGEYGYMLDGGLAHSIQGGAEENGVGGVYLQDTMGVQLAVDVVYTSAVGTRHAITVNGAKNTVLLGGVLQGHSSGLTSTSLGLRHVGSGASSVINLGTRFEGAAFTGVGKTNLPYDFMDFTGAGIVQLGNTSNPPTAIGSMGGGVLYVQGGALRYRGSAGTVTTIAPA